MTQPERGAKLVLVTPDGTVIGSLPPFPVDVPWWQDSESVVRAARERHGLKVTILRLLGADREKMPGGVVTYLAEVEHPVPAEPWPGTLEPHPLRQTYANPGGPAADLRWAMSVLDRHGMTLAGDPVQVRTWNLSSVWRIPVIGQTTWLKVVPPFFAHEGRMLEALAGQSAPRLLGHDGGRVLLAEIPGEDMYDAPLPALLDMVAILVGIQSSWIGRTPKLTAMGLPDWRGAALAAAIEHVVDRTRRELAPGDAEMLDRFVADIPRRLVELAACGLPDTLVHGDFHPGNVRGTPGNLTLLDWGDSGIGHPLLDQPAFLDRIPAQLVDTISEHWNQQWRDAVPGSNPTRASRLLAPVAAARQAVIYRKFLDNIEPSEHPYHRDDPADWLSRTAKLLRKES